MTLFRPDVEHFLCLIIFGLISTVGLILWTYEDGLLNGSEHRRLIQEAEENAVYGRVIESFIHDERRMRELRAEQFPEFPDIDDDDLDPDDPSILDRHRKRPTKSPLEKADGVLKQIDTDFMKSERKKINRRDSKRRHSNGVKTLKESEVLGGIRGGPAFCSIYDTNRYNNDTFECIKITFKPPVQVCLYPESMDVHVSHHLRTAGVWEPHILRHFQNLLYQNPELGVYDIGAHIGQYSLLAASMGRHVVAVEPHPPSQRRLHKAITLGKLEDKVDQLFLTIFSLGGTLRKGSACHGTQRSHLGF